MKALILNSGLGKRMGRYTVDCPKCMVPLTIDETVVSRQLSLLKKCGINEVVITTGPHADKLEAHIHKIANGIDCVFVNNPRYAETNYIYSIYLAKEYLHDDILLLHGDLVFEEAVLKAILERTNSSMVVSSSVELPEKDFKAVITDNKIKAVGIEFFENALAAQPLYYLKKKDWELWLDEIANFCEKGVDGCYAENALNMISEQIDLRPYDCKCLLCQEVDKEEDLLEVRARLGV